MIHLSLFMYMLFSLPAYGDEQVTTLKEGEHAPFAGTLFNTEAAARILSELKFGEEECKIKTDAALKFQRAESDLKFNTLQASYNSLNYKHTELIRIKDGQIAFYEKEVLRRKISPELWYLLGIGSGVVITIGAGYALNQVAGQ